MRVGFLLNHERAHQVAHALPIALSLARGRPDTEVRLMFAAGAVEAEVRRAAAGHPANLSLVPLRPVPRAVRAAGRLLGNGVPVERVAALRSNLDLFRDLDALVVPEKTSLLLKSRFGLSQLKLIHCRHGAGDRAVGFDRASGRFDLVLLSGPKIRDRLASAGLLRPGGHAMVGYPKFDMAGPRTGRRLFANDRPTVLYNPHPSPALSSWYRYGPYILDHFAKSRDYNLIFAPHVMLFARRFNVSLAPPRLKRVGAIPAHVRNADNILIDTGSAASVDMTYTNAADIYLGDASSQVYEFIARPRPCIFVNANRHDWAGDPDFAHWAAGPVIDRLDALDGALRDLAARPDAYAPVQRELFEYSFDLDGRPSADRAAEAIVAFLGG